MTSFLPPSEQFAAGYYIRDFTRVCYFSRVTMKYIGDHWRAKIKFEGGDIALYRRDDTR